MELTKEQMKLVIRCLSDIKFLNQTNKNPFKSSIDLKELPTVIDLFKKYLNSGEVIWGSEAFIDEVFKTLYGNEYEYEVWSYNDALQKIKNLVQLQEQN